MYALLQSMTAGNRVFGSDYHEGAGDRKAAGAIPQGAEDSPCSARGTGPGFGGGLSRAVRSEERRVGKECRL